LRVGRRSEKPNSTCLVENFRRFFSVVLVLEIEIETEDEDEDEHRMMNFEWGTGGAAGGENIFIRISPDKAG